MLLNALRTGFALSCLLTVATAQHQAPPIFQDLDFQTAKAQAQKEGKIFLVDAMTSWCGPCKQMDRSTWIDQGLVDWMQKHVVAIQLDMDEHEALKKEMAIKAFPTIVIYKGDKEFDRVVGLRNAPTMKQWLQQAVAGRTELDQVLLQLEEVRGLEDAKVDVRHRLHLANSLLEYGQFKEATAEYLWLWNKIPSLAPKLNQQRWTKMRWSLQSLTSKHVPAQEQFKAIRDALTNTVQAETAELHLQRDWLELNNVLGEDSLTVAWAEKMAQTPAGVQRLRTLNHRLFPMLVAAGKWREAGLGLSQPVTTIAQFGSQLGAYDVSAKAETSKGKEPKPMSMPAIPMGGMKPKPSSTPKDAAGGKPKSIPAIPMGGGKGMAPAIPTKGKTGRQAQTPEEVAAEVRRRLTNSFQEKASQYYAALLAADRKSEAGKVAEQLFRFVDEKTARASLSVTIKQAGCMNKVPESHGHWLNEETH